MARQGIDEALAATLPPPLKAALDSLLDAHPDRASRVKLIEQALRGPQGPMVREALGEWIVSEAVPASALVPEKYREWRPIVRDAMLFVVRDLSAPRLAPKLLEQVELPLRTRPEQRLLRLIAKVPGLQKLGQIIARNRHLGRRLRSALILLENGIRDVEPEQAAAMVREQLGAAQERFEVRLGRKLLREASVSAILPFTWRDPESGRRERGVFKVLKPHIPTFFPEDMRLLQDLTRYFGKRLHEYGFATGVLADTFAKVRRLLQHEVDFAGEQRTLRRASAIYASTPGIRVPRTIPPLCTASVTAMSYESGRKVTEAATRMTVAHRARLAEQLVKALVAVPLFAADDEVLFHADPHAGNLLYDEARGDLVLLDWALTERLTREQRRHLALLLLTISWRDPVGVCRAVETLRQPGARLNPRRQRAMQEFVAAYLEQLPVSHFAQPVDAMRLIEQLTLMGIRFPASLVMLSKVLFTLDGILEDIGGSGAHFVFAIAGHLLQRWVVEPAQVSLPLKPADLVALNWSAVLYPTRVAIKWEEALLNRLLPRRKAAAA